MVAGSTDARMSATTSTKAESLPIPTYEPVWAGTSVSFHLCSHTATYAFTYTHLCINLYVYI
jgi:hypothetical protein